MSKNTEKNMKLMSLLFALVSLLAPAALAQVPPIGGGGQVNVNVTVSPPPTWSLGIRNVWEVPNGTPISYFGFQANVTSTTGSNAKLNGGMTPMPPTAVPSEWSSDGQFLPTPFMRTPTTGVLEDDTFYIVSFGATPQGGFSTQLWFEAYIIVGKPKDAGFNVDIQFDGAAQADNATVTLALNTTMTSCYPAFSASYTTTRVIMHTHIEPVGSTGIVESEFCGGPAWVVNAPLVWPVSGTFNTYGQHTFRIIAVVEDFSAAYVTEFTVDVPPPALTITSQSPLPNGTAASPYDFPFAAAGGVPPYTWSATGLPAGWQMTSSGQLMCSTPQAGAINFTAIVTDSLSSTDSLPCVVTIDPLPPLLIQTLVLPAGTQGYPYAANLTATGGSGSGYAWALLSGTLPPGVTGLPGGGTPDVALGGAPAATGLFAFEVQVTDDAGNVAAMPLSIQIDAQSLGGGGAGDGGGACAASSSSAAACWWLISLVAGAGLLARRNRARA